MATSKSKRSLFSPKLFVAVGGALFFTFLISCEMGPGKNSLYAQALRGKTHYEKLCMDCHGADGRGVMIDTMITQPKDLTNIMKRWDVGEFPIQKIAEFIDGRKAVKAHGPRSMPAWGDYFAGEEQLSNEEIRGKMGELIAYIMSIQR